MKIKLSVCLLVSPLFSAMIVQGHESSLSEFNFRKHVRPIFAKNCGGCHRVGGAAPMSLMEYGEAVPWANSVKLQVLNGTMPPWLPIDGVGDYRHVRSLTAKEIDVIVDWAVGQTPEGEPFTKDELQWNGQSKVYGWDRGEPGIVLQSDTDVVMDVDDYELSPCVVFRANHSKSVIATRFDVKTQLSKVLRKATIYLGPSCDAGRPLATWISGQESLELPPGFGQLLPAGSQISVEFLYVKNWEDEEKFLTDRIEVGIWLSSSANEVRSVQLSRLLHSFDQDVSLLAVFPNPSVVGTGDVEDLRVDIVHKDGYIEPILVIERFRTEWREKYVFVEPIGFPLGAELRVSQPTVWVDFVTQ